MEWSVLMVHSNRITHGKVRLNWSTLNYFRVSNQTSSFSRIASHLLKVKLLQMTRALSCVSNKIENSDFRYSKCTTHCVKDGLIDFLPPSIDRLLSLVLCQGNRCLMQLPVPTDRLLWKITEIILNSLRLKSQRTRCKWKILLNYSCFWRNSQLIVFSWGCFTCPGRVNAITIMLAIAI